MGTKIRILILSVIEFVLRPTIWWATLKLKYWCGVHGAYAFVLALSSWCVCRTYGRAAHAAKEALAAGRSMRTFNAVAAHRLRLQGRGVEARMLWRARAGQNTRLRALVNL